MKSTMHAVPPASDSPADEVEFSAYISTVIGARWLIGGVALVALLVGVAYAFLARPVYRSDVLLQIEEKNGGVGGIEEFNALLSGETPAETEIEILRSRSLLGSVVDALKLDYMAEPRYFPLIGRGIARLRDARDLREAPFGLSSFAWGGERIQLDRLVVPTEFEGASFTLVAGEKGTYTVYGPESEELLTGQVGATSKSTVERGVELFVSELRARKGTKFRLIKRARGEVVDELQKSLVMREKGKKTGILLVALEGTNPKHVADTLDAIATAYLRQNVERRSAEAEKTLEFLNAQMPELRAKLEAAESALNTYRAKSGSVDMGLETQAVLDRAVAVEKQVSALSMERSELKQRYTDSHPAMLALRQKLEQLERERVSVNSHLKGLPETELNAARLMRDVKVANELYVLLLNKAQELRVVKSGTIGNVRILDAALLTKEPVRPLKATLIGLSLVVGLALGVVLAFARKSLIRGVEDPDAIERALGIPIYATIPLSDQQSRLERASRKNLTLGRPMLASVDSSDLTIESLRSLRTSLQFALVDAANNVLSITGPSPGIGKSFVSANLAQILADAGMKILLVDADMRRGRLHEYFGGEKVGGLSEVISGRLALNDAVRTKPDSKLSFLSCGTVPPNPSELLMSPRFRQFIEDAGKQYDLVLVDTPPVLAVTDGSIVAKLAGVNLMVVRAGRHPMGEIDAALRRLTRNGVRVQGVVFNAVERRTGTSAGTYAYHYEYKSQVS